LVASNVDKRTTKTTPTPKIIVSEGTSKSGKRKDSERSDKMEEFRNGLEGGAKRSRRQKGKKRSSAVLADSNDVSLNNDISMDDDVSTKVAKFDSPSKLKLKFVVQSSKGSEGGGLTFVRNLADDKSPTRSTKPESSPSSTMTSPSAEFTSPSKLRMKISMTNKSVSMSHDDSFDFPTTPKVDKLTIKNIDNCSENSFKAENSSETTAETNVDTAGSKKKLCRVPEFILDRSSRVRSYFRRRHAPFKRTFDLVNTKQLL
jgi:hypothetical protein